MQTLAPEELVRLCQRTLPDDTRAFELLVSMYNLVLAPIGDTMPLGVMRLQKNA